MIDLEVAAHKVDITCIFKQDRHYLRFLFQGDFKEDAAIRGITMWQKEIEVVQSGEKVDLIWDCLAMEKYSAGAANL